MHDYYEQGRQDVYNRLGMTKEAAGFGWAKSLGKLWSKYRPRPTWGGAKRLAIGEPGKFMRELSEGKTFSRGGMLHEDIRDSMKGTLGKALFLGLPAYEAYNVMQQGGPGKAEHIGGLLASTPVMMATWKPLGILGSIAATGVAERMGRGAGRMFEKGLQPPQPPPYAPYYPPPQYPYGQNF